MSGNEQVWAKRACQYIRQAQQGGTAGFRLGKLVSVWGFNRFRETKNSEARSLGCPLPSLGPPGLVLGPSTFGSLFSSVFPVRCLGRSSVGLPFSFACTVGIEVAGNVSLVVGALEDLVQPRALRSVNVGGGPSGEEDGAGADPRAH